MTALEPTLVQRWTRWRKTVAVVAILIVGAIALALAQSQQSRGFLNPEGVDEGGARALVRILEDQGVPVTATRTTGATVETTSSGDTVLVTNPDLLVSEQIDALHDTGADLVLIAPDASLSDFDPRLTDSSGWRTQVVDPDCGLTAVELAGPARMGGRTYEAPGSAWSCYPGGGSPSLVVLESHGATVTILGTGDPLTNRRLDEDGNASLALNILGAGDGLTWYRPTLEPGFGGNASFVDVMPGWVGPVAWQLGIAAALAALWRARRFGPLVAEPLPVVVHAAEVTEGRATLYRHSRARGHAARNLRGAAIARLRARLGLPLGATAAEVAEAVASRTGRPEREIVQLLDGDEPDDEPALVRLANDLTDLEAQL